MNAREQSARAYTLREIDRMREALRERWFNVKFPPTGGSRGGSMEGRNAEVEAELQTALVGNVDPDDLVAECAKVPGHYAAPQA